MNGNGEGGGPATRTRRWTALGLAVALSPSLAPGILELGCLHLAELECRGARGPHAGMMAELAASRAPEASAPAPCTCLGESSTSSSATSAPEGSVLFLDLDSPAAAVIPLSSGLAAATHAPYVLPFANGPPGPQSKHAAR